MLILNKIIFQQKFYYVIILKFEVHTDLVIQMKK